MAVCPMCKSEIAGPDSGRKTCPACGAALPGIQQTPSVFEQSAASEQQNKNLGLFGSAHHAAGELLPALGGIAACANADEPRLPMPTLLAGLPAGGPGGQSPLEKLPHPIDFGPSSPPWPQESAETAPQAAMLAPQILRTITSSVPPDEGDATRDDQRPLRTIDSTSSALSPDAIAALWSGTHEPATSPQTTIRRPEPLSGSPRDSRLIITGRSIQPVQSPLRASADYELLETIGEGGVGVVYAARQASIDRTVAVKMLKPATAQKPEQREKFLSEAVVTGDLDHPNIVPIYDLGTNESGALFYSMKRVEGTPWVNVLAKKSLAENLEILLKVADAVAFAHSRGVIHRDIKPENVMLGEYGEVLVMDWGLALVTPEFRKSRTVTPATSMGGTPAYMAPEMAVGPVTRVTRASDVYLLGAILYEIITGQPPHMAKTVNACLVAAARNHIQPTLHRGELIDIALTAMATDPVDRYASVRDFQNAVRQYQAHSESIVLSTRAELELADARKNDDYELFSRAVFGFQEAYALWTANDRARQGLSEAKLAYAECAAVKGDFDLASSLLDPADKAHASQIEAVAVAQRERALRQQRLKNAKRIVKGLAAAMLLIVSGALVWVSHLYGVAEHEAQVAKEQKAEADVQRDVAITATGRAIQKTKEAEIQRAKAELAKSEEEYAGYIAKIGLSAAKVEENAFGEVDQLLEQCPSRLRNWEWGRLKFLCGRALRTFPGYAPLEAVAFDTAGKRFVTAGADGKLRVWSIENDREPLAELDYGDTYIVAVAFSPDGRHVAAGGDDKDGGYVKIWNLETREFIGALHGHSAQVLSVVYNGDGSRLLTASFDATARLWDATTGECLKTFKGHSWWVWSAAFSPAEDAVVTAGQDRKCIVWPLDEYGDGDLKGLRIFTGHSGPVYSAVFSRDGKYVISGGYDQRVLVWHRDEAKPFSYESLATGSKAPPPNYKTLDGHTAAVRAVRITGKGAQRILSAGHDNTIKIWDFETGSLIQTLRGHAGWIRGCDVSSDGQLAVSASHDHEAKLWNLQTYEEVRVLNARVLSGHADAILSAAFSADDRQVITSSRDRTARTWSFTTGEMLRSFAEGHEFLASHAIFFRDGRRFLTSGIDSTVRMWDLASGTELRELTGTGASALVAMSADERWLLTANGSAALLWNIETGEQVQTFGGHHGEVTAIAFSPDGRHVFTGDVTGRTRLWDRDTGDIVWDQRAHSAGVNSAVFTPDGNRVLTASDDHTVSQFDATTGNDLIHETLKHGVPVLSIAITRDGNRVITNAKDARIRIWDLKQRRVEHVIEGLPNRVSNLSLSPDGSQFVTVTPLPVAGNDKRDGNQTSVIQFWNVQTGEEIPQTRIESRMVWSAIFAPTPGQALLIGSDRASLCEIDGGARIMTFSPHGAVTSANYSPDQTRIVTSGGDASAKVWDVASGAALFKLALAHDGPINSAVYSPDGRFILTASNDRTARLWSASSGDLIQTFAGHTQPVRSAGFSTDGMYIVTASSDRSVRVWDLTGRVVLELAGHAAAVACAAFSADGNRIVSGGDDNAARIWDACTGECLGKLPGHTAAVTSVCFSPDGSRVLTGSHDSTAKVWDTQTAKEILTLKGHSEGVTSVAFSNSGRYALTGSRDGTAIVWLAEEWRSTREFADLPTLSVTSKGK